MSIKITRRLQSLLVLALVFILVTGLVPVKAASNKWDVTVKSSKQLIKAMTRSEVSTITYKSKKSGDVTIPSKAASKNKKLIIDTPNINITNKSAFKTVTLKNVKSYTEKKSGNKIYASSKNTVLSITSKKKADVFCNLKGATVTLTAGKKSTVNITLSKKTNLVLTGSNAATVNILSKAKGSKVTAFIPMYLEAVKNMSVVLYGGSEGSIIDKRNSSISVKVTNNSTQGPSWRINGEENPASITPTKKPTSTPKPVTPTPTPKPTGTTTDNVVIGYSTFTGGGSSGGYSGGSSGGYSGGGSSSGTSGGSSGSTDTGNAGGTTPTTIPTNVPSVTTTPTPTPTLAPAPEPDYTATTKAELDTLLTNLSGSNNKYRVLFKANNLVDFEIADGNYTNITLVIDAPYATIKNYARFDIIELRNISDHTWFEHGNSNTILSYVMKSRIVVGAGSINTIIKIESGVKVIIENNGTGHSISGLYVNTCTKVYLKGTNHTSYPVCNQGKNATITSSVEVEIQTNCSFNFQVLAGGENSNIISLGNNVDINVTGVGNISVYNFITDVTYDITAGQLIDEDLDDPIDNGNVSGEVFLDNGDAAGDVCVKAYFYYSKLEDAVAQTPLTRKYTDSEGYYEFDNLEYGNYYLEYTRSGYKTVYRVLCVSAEDVQLDETILIAESNETTTVKGTLLDATTGEPINTKRITVIMRSGLDNVSGDILTSSITDNTGSFVFYNIPGGNYTLQVSDDRGSLDGQYTRLYKNINVIPSNEDATYDILVNYQDATESAQDDADGKLRFVLEWNDSNPNGSVPADLDSHLVSSTDNQLDNIHIYCDNRSFSSSSAYVELDIDDISYKGPETTTVHQVSDGVYRFYVYDYSDKDNQSNKRLSSSGATVRVYRGSREIGVYHVPTRKTGTLWYVCTYDTTTNVLMPINEVTYHAGTPEEIGKDPTREAAFTLDYVVNSNEWLYNVSSDLDTLTMHIRGHAATLCTDAVFYYEHTGSETVYTPVTGQAYAGIAKVTYKGESLEFRVFYTQVFDVKILGDALLYNYNYTTIDFTSTDTSTITIYGEKLPEGLTVDFKPNDVTYSFDQTVHTLPNNFAPYQTIEIGTIHAQYKGRFKDIIVKFTKDTDAFDRMEIEAEGLIYPDSYSLYSVSSSRSTTNTGEGIRSFYKTVYSESRPTITTGAAITFDNKDVTYTYEPLSDSNYYIGVIHATYKEFTGDIKVQYSPATDVLDKVNIEINGFTHSYKVNREYDYDNNVYNYYITLHGLIEPSNYIVSFENSNVRYTVDYERTKDYLGIIHATYNTTEQPYARDIKILYRYRDYEPYEVCVSSESIGEQYYRINKIINQVTDQLLYYYIDIQSDTLPEDLNFSFDNSEILYTYTPETNEDYAGTLHTDYYGISQDIRVYYTFRLNNVNVYADGTTDDNFYVRAHDNGYKVTDYYYINVYGTTPVINPVIKTSNPSVYVTYEPVSNSEYVGIIHSSCGNYTQDIRVYYEQEDDPYKIYTYVVNGIEISQQTICWSNDNSSEIHEFVNGRLIKNTYTRVDDDNVEYTSVYEYEYDVNGNQIKTTYTDSQGHINTTGYDANGVRIEYGFTTTNIENFELDVIDDNHYFDYAPVDVPATAAAIRVEKFYHGSEDGNIAGHIKEANLYTICDNQEELFITANYAYNYNGYAIEATWIYVSDGSYKKWILNGYGKGTVTTYSSDGTIIDPETLYGTYDYNDYDDDY